VFFLRVQALTRFNLQNSDLVLSTFQTMTVIMVVITLASLIATAAVVGQLGR
jgi:hypothetical protein